MQKLGILAVSALLALSTAVAQAQTQTQSQAQAQTQTQAGAPAGPPGRMMGGRGPGGGMGPRWGAHNTYGWSLMTAQERQEHMAKMGGFANRKECEAYVTEHHRLMAERAKQRGTTMPAEPRRKPCADLP